MITTESYFSGKPHDVQEDANAQHLLEAVNALIDQAVYEGAFTRNVDPDTGTEISGSKGGAGDGGFRLPTATTGAPQSSHKQAKAVDVYDPHNRLDDYLTRFDDGSNNAVLEKFGLYRESPEKTPGWTHLQTRAPGSGRRTFQP